MLFGGDVPVLPLGAVVGLILLGIRQAMRDARSSERVTIEICMWAFLAGFVALLASESRPGRRWLAELDADKLQIIRVAVIVTLGISATLVGALGGGRWLAEGFSWPGASPTPDADEGDPPPS